MFFSCFCLFLTLVNSEDAPLINTSTGPVVGTIKKTTTGTTYLAYEGIRYGVASRFLDPEETPLTPQLTVATREPLGCPQWDPELNLVRGSEDCLYLSIFSPQREMQPNTSLPVLLVIPGRHFVSGTSVRPQLMMDRGIIVVSVNYRLGVLGFLSTNDTSAAGNFGLLDLRLSFRWIRKNIEFFGGDARRVTLMGHDSGAALISYLLADPLVKDMEMVVGAITMSGNGLCPWAVQENPIAHAHLIAQGLDCDCNSTSGLVECIRKSSVEDLVSVERATHHLYASFPLIATPSVDAGLRANPAVAASLDHVLKSDNNISKVPLVTGIVKHEGAHILAEIFLQHWPQMEIDHSYLENQLLGGLIRALGRFQRNIDEILTLVKYHYYHKGFDSGQDADVVARTLNMISDMVYNRCNRLWSQMYQEATQMDVYSYSFEYRGRMSTMEFIINELKKLNGTQTVVENLQNVINHGDDLIYILDDGSLKETDQEVQKTMSDLWAHFVQHQKMPESWRSTSLSSNQHAIIRGAHFENVADHNEQDDHFLRYLYTIERQSNEVHYDKHKAESVVGESSSSTGISLDINYTAATWTLLVISIILLIGMCFFIYLYIIQRKKTTYITRSPVHRQRTN